MNSFSDMNRANYQKLFQRANQGVITIRQEELNYYLNLHGSFGTKAALIGGFTYGILTQNVINFSSRNIDIYRTIYYFFATCTIASALHVILCTMLIQVYAQGLALHGPLGSMWAAAQGMEKESTQIVASSLFMVVSFCSATIFLFWCVMSMHQAIGATLVFLVVVRQMFYYSERIYLRFYWKKENNWKMKRDAATEEIGEEEDDAPWEMNPIQEDDGDEEDEAPDIENGRASLDADPSSQPQQQQLPAQVQAQAPRRTFPTDFASLWKSTSSFTTITSNSNSSGDEITPPKTPDGGLFSHLYRTHKETLVEGHIAAVAKAATLYDTIKYESLAAHGHDGDASSSSNGGGHKVKRVAMEGYFTIKGRQELQQVIREIDIEKMMIDTWERKYFVLLAKQREFYIYHTRQEFRANPKEPIYTRPLRLVEYYVKYDNSEQASRAESPSEPRRSPSVTGSVSSTAAAASRSHGGTVSVFSADALPFKFEISLVPRESVKIAAAAAVENQEYYIGANAASSHTRAEWHLRCDTEEELEIWLGAIRDVCPSCFRE